MGVLPYAQCCWWKLEHGCSAEAITEERTGEGRDNVNRAFLHAPKCLSHPSRQRKRDLQMSLLPFKMC